MLRFVTNDRLISLGIFYAVNYENIVELEDVNDPSFSEKGILAERCIILESNRVKPDYRVKKEIQMVLTLYAAVDSFQAGKHIPSTPQGYEMMVTQADVSWATYKITIVK